MSNSIHQAAFAALMLSGADEKCAAVSQLLADWRGGRLVVLPAKDDPEPVSAPGRPDRPLLVPVRQVPRRRVTTAEGRAAMLHAIVHIEFNAINLALDCVHRFRALPTRFHEAWLEVAAEEALHFVMLRERLRAAGFDYGDFDAHDGLWDMACRTAHDPLERMALVPRVLEARGLDATPVIIAKLAAVGDHDSIRVLERILHDEVGHVALGDHWFRRLCESRGLAPEPTYLALLERFGVPLPRPPLNEAARRAAGFAEEELCKMRAAASPTRAGVQAGSGDG